MRAEELHDKQRRSSEVWSPPEGQTPKTAPIGQKSIEQNDSRTCTNQPVFLSPSGSLLHHYGQRMSYHHFSRVISAWLAI
ncbi:hypothetical protein PAXRUDRAFT_831714 [Paxillus rubicundulus Ve08.2h10]|uniref:Uncharacterized protein n=1 Tax=Paxillus rubicundulus Ve08.2h10 TaxID=930991 RepID=A0A0D0DRM9_9AGAM|nr:hypothetical protein PAXRUDRAFT_831714 [Paxillus rubicundulus Ve08.2h10]